MPRTIPAVIPVRVYGGGVSMQTTSSRIGAEALFVRALIAPKEGSRVELGLWLPGSARPLEAAGTVVAAPGEAANEAGFWVRIEELSDDARAFLDVLLRSRGIAGVGRPTPRADTRAESRRAYARVPARLRVGWRPARQFLVAYSDNISRGGLFIASDDPPPLREVLELTLDLPDGKGPVKTHAEVVHRLTKDQARGGAVPGVGVQFVGASDEFRQRLDACIDTLLTQES